MNRPILLLHEEETTRRELQSTLERAGFSVEAPVAMPSLWALLTDGGRELILWSWTAAELPVAEALPRLKSESAAAPSRVIVVAPRAHLEAAVRMLDVGADDCFAAPPLLDAELVARVNACLRRRPDAGRRLPLRAGPVLLDLQAHCVLVDNEPVELAPAEFRLLVFFLENQGRVFSRDELLRRAWTKSHDAGERTVDVHVRRLRSALEGVGCDKMIQTVRGFGYRFSAATGERTDRACVDRQDAAAAPKQSGTRS